MRRADSAEKRARTTGGAGGDEGGRRRTVVALAVATGAVALSLAGLIVFYGFELREVRPATQAIRSRGAPGTKALDLAEAALRRLDGSLDEQLLNAIQGRPVSLAPIQKARAELAAQIAAYRGAHHEPRDAELDAAVATHFQALDGTLGRLLGALDRRDLEASNRIENGEWRSVSDALDGDFHDLTSAQIGHILENADEIDGRWQSATAGALGIGIFALVLVLVSMRVVASVVRRQQRLGEERALELELFAQRMAHDVSSPLAATLIALQLAQRTEDERIRKACAHGIASLHRSQSVVEALLDFARSGARPELGAHAPVAPLVAGLLEELRPQADEAGIELIAGAAPEGEVACPAGVLTVILSNLVRNALKFMGDRTTRRIDLRVESRPRSFVFEVEDTGPGLPSGVGPEIFELYVRGPTGGARGAGVGLATVRRLAVAYGGSVDFRSTEGRGTTFRVELPRWLGPASRRVGHSPTGEP